MEITALYLAIAAATLGAAAWAIAVRRKLVAQHQVIQARTHQLNAERRLIKEYRLSAEQALDREALWDPEWAERMAELELGLTEQ